MPCYTPLNAWSTVTLNKEGKRGIVFSPKNGKNWEPIALSCGQCIGCRIAQSRRWAIRCTHEASLHTYNSFVTLTYNDDSLPENGSLVKRDVQLFLKRLRRRFPCLRIRFYCCGEYGEKLSRPHYHIILFGHDFHDKYHWSTRNGVRLYRSAILESLWTFGYSSVGDVNFESAAYVARYCLKKRNGDIKESHYRGLAQEFSTMSRRPGIAREWIEQFKDDVYPHDYVVLLNGVKCKPPRYYDNIYDLTNSEDMLLIKSNRQEYAEGNPDNLYDRLSVREKVQKSKLPLLKRSIE